MTLYGILNPGRAMACEVMGRAGVHYPGNDDDGGAQGSER